MQPTRNILTMGLIEMAKAQMRESFFAAIEEEFEKPYIIKLRDNLNEQSKNHTILPKYENIFKAFSYFELKDTKVVILGQDPYPNRSHAMGLSFSTPDGAYLPKSLINIYKELETDLNIKHAPSGNLENWAKQGVLLLNSTLTLNEGESLSHAKFGWEIFTDNIISKISSQTDFVVFLLMGNFAKKKKCLIDTNKHTVIETAHPSPLSAFSGFFGSRPFSRINDALKSKGIEEIDFSR